MFIRKERWATVTSSYSNVPLEHYGRILQHKAKYTHEAWVCEMHKQTLQSSQQDVLGANGNLSLSEESYIPYPGSWLSE